MQSIFSLLLAVFITLFLFSTQTDAFAPLMKSSQSAMAPMNPVRVRSTQLMMGGNKAKFSYFSPFVVIAKVVLGEQKLNKIRGKAIALHSQAITDWCLQYGAYNMRLKLIKMAKKNGDELGFLV